MDRKKEAIYSEIGSIGDCLGSMTENINMYSSECSNAIGYLGKRLRAISEQLIEEELNSN